jgi:hypothetical protein
LLSKYELIDVIHILLMSQLYLLKILFGCFVGREMGDQSLFRSRPQTLNMNELLQRQRHKTFDANFVQKSNSTQNAFCDVT